MENRKLFCPHCKDDFFTPDGLVVHIKLLHPEFMACLHSTSIGWAHFAYRCLD